MGRLILIILILLCGCIGGPTDHEEYKDPFKTGLTEKSRDRNIDLDDDDDEGESVRDKLIPVGKAVYRVTDKGGEYDKKKKVVRMYWTLKGEDGFPPSSRKHLCLEPVRVPIGFATVPSPWQKVRDGKVHIEFGTGGNVTYEFPVSFSGSYEYGICGVESYEGARYKDERAYAGDGDAVTVEVPDISTFYVKEKSCTIHGAEGKQKEYYGLTCNWTLQFSDGSFGVCEEFRQPGATFRITMLRDGKGGVTKTRNCAVLSDQVVLKTSVKAGAGYYIAINGTERSEMVYGGSGDPILVNIPG